MNRETEYEKFDRTVREVLKASHAEIKSKLKAEKKRKKSKKSSASGRAKSDRA